MKHDKRISSLHPLILSGFEYLRCNNKAQICYPTGVGKGYLMTTDIYHRLFIEDEKIIGLFTHRLSLNNQHLKDIVTYINEKIVDIGIINIGSSNEDSDILEHVSEKVDILSTENYLGSTNTELILDRLASYKKRNLKIIIISTYHSLDKAKGIRFDTVYCDEAHRLATSNETDFMKNFSNIISVNKYFTTATPKDMVHETDGTISHKLMNNESFYGKRIGISLSESIDNTLIVPPKLILSHPSEYAKGRDLNSIKNKVSIIVDTVNIHRNNIKNFGIAPKLLIKCESIIELIDIEYELNELMYNVAACSSNKDHGYFINKNRRKRDNFIEEINSYSAEEELLVLHVDMLTEGLNLNGMTGVCFLNNNITTITSFMQNVGRVTRLHPYDREHNALVIKPFCEIFIPYFDDNSLDKAEKMTSILATAFYGTNIMSEFITYDEIIEGSDHSITPNFNPYKEPKRVRIAKMIEHSVVDLSKRFDFLEASRLDISDADIFDVMFD